jgi:hypothetical protein
MRSMKAGGRAGDDRWYTVRTAVPRIEERSAPQGLSRCISGSDGTRTHATPKIRLRTKPATS